MRKRNWESSLGERTARWFKDSLVFAKPELLAGGGERGAADAAIVLPTVLEVLLNEDGVFFVELMAEAEGGDGVDFGGGHVVADRPFDAFREDDGDEVLGFAGGGEQERGFLRAADEAEEAAFEDAALLLGSQGGEGVTSVKVVIPVEEVEGATEGDGGSTGGYSAV